MPRIAGLNVVAVLAGAVAYYLVGMVIYGFTLNQVWGEEMLRNHGILAPGAAAPTGDALMAELGKIPNQMGMAESYGLGFLVCLTTTLGIAWVLKLAKPASIGAAIGVGLGLFVCFAVTGLAYNVIYSSESRTIFGIDLLYNALGFVLAAAAVFLLDGKAIRVLPRPDWLA